MRMNNKRPAPEPIDDSLRIPIPFKDAVSGLLNVKPQASTPRKKTPRNPQKPS
jgi:hypothetical protein